VYPDALAPGTEVGTWRVVERVGMGGYGTVYRVEDMARPGDFYAYKLAQYADDKRMVREMALMMAKGEHPNVVRFHGCARWPHPKDGYPGFVMDWVPGPPIHLWAETEGSTFRQLAEAGGKVALAVGTLHERGVLHRDLKPEHIIIRESDGEPVLLDFGAGWYEGAEPLTSGTLPPGTLPMRSPESLRFLWDNHKNPEAHYSFQRTDDLYALGVCLYRAATGHYPFPEGMPDLLQCSIVLQRPHAPSDFNRRVPRALSEVILRLLAKNPRDRYQSGAEVHEALVAAVAFGKPKQWDAGIFEWEEVAPEKEGDKPQRRLRRPAWPTQPVTPPPPKLVIPPPVHPVRRVRRGRAPGQPAPEPALKDEQHRGVHRKRSVLAGSAVIVLGLVLLFMTTWLGLGPFASTAPTPPVASSFSPPTPGEISGQEVAPSGPPPEIGRAAAPPREETTPAAVAPLATRPKDDILKKQKRTLSPVARWCLGAAAAASTACPGPGPQVRPTPAPEECPEGAVETMTGTLGLFINSEHPVSFPNVRPPKALPVREGFTSMEVSGRWGNLPGKTLLLGQLHFREGHIYGRFTEARTPAGDSFKVCMQIFTGETMIKRGGGFYKSGPGTEMEPGSTPDNVLMFSIQKVKPVRRFD